MSEDPSMSDDTIQDYFERAEEAGMIDFHLRIVRAPEGWLDFYINPQDGDGETGDFTVFGSVVCKIKDNMSAGSSRPISAPFLGSGKP